MLCNVAHKGLGFRSTQKQQSNKAKHQNRGDTKMTGKCWAEVIAWNSWSADYVVESRMIENGTYDKVSDFIDRTANELMEKR